MLISLAPTKDKEIWNNFVKNNYPPSGAFMASWVWGSFQAALGRKTERYFITAAGQIVGAFILVQVYLPLRQKYGYAPRGPVLSRDFFDTAEKIGVFFKTMMRWAKKNFPNFIFLRLEPPLAPENIARGSGLIFPDYYIQPRRNLAINLMPTAEEILAKFHPSTRSNVKKAERKGVTAEIKKEMSTADWHVFFKMAGETVARNAGKNIYPSRSYFETMVKTIPHLDKANSQELSLSFFCGYQDGEPAAMNLVLFFGQTATYLFGVSATSKLPSKVTTFLHWYGMTEAKSRGYHYYDLGGIDEKLWPSLTVFKRRFGGEESEYLGNIDLVINPLKYKIYNIARKARK